MAYPCDLPANMGNTDIFRAIYSKIGGDSSSGGGIEKKLDTIISLTDDVNNNIQINTEAIKENTQAVKDITINVDVHSDDLQNITNAIDRQTQAIKDVSINVDTKGIRDEIANVNHSVNTLNNNMNYGFERTIRAIKNQPVPPQPKPCPQCHHHHHHHHHHYPQPRPFIPEPTYQHCQQYVPNDLYYHNAFIQSRSYLTTEQKTYLEQVDRNEIKFNQREYNSLPSYIQCTGVVTDVYNNLIYNFY